MPWVAPCPPDTPAIAWSINFVPIGDGPNNITGSQNYCRLPDQGNRARSLPTLVIRIREPTDSPSQGLPIQARVAALDKFGSVAPDQLGTKHVSNSIHKYQVQH